MRPTTTSTMLQQNNNNNYPCLNMSGSTREMLQKCSRASLPFPSRLELGDLPLIRGLRAWALCSKNRRKAGSLLGGGQAPTAPPPAGRGGSISCPRPADVYLSGEWGRMGYGLPLGLDAGQAGIGALVTVATLKTSEGSGKTQTQCLFLRTEKGSCLYSTAKPGSGVTTSAASSGVGGWLRGKTGGGGGGSRDHGPAPPAQTGANRVRVRSGRRWRKSCNATGREKTERQQGRSGKDPAGEITLDERPEERDKGGLVDSKQFPSPQQDIRRKEGAVRSHRCCHNASPKTCAQCGRRTQRRASQDEHEGGESPRKGDQNAEVKGMRKERQKNAEEEEEEEGVLAVPNPDLESNRFHPETQSSCDAEEIRVAESNAELKTETSHSEDDEDTNSEVMKIHTNSDSHSEDFTSRHSGDFDNRKHGENPSEEIVNGFSDDVEEHQESEKDMESVDVEEDEPTPAEFLALSTCLGVSPEASSPIEGSTCDADHETCGVLREHLDEYQQGVAVSLIMGKEELDGLLEQQEANCAVDENNTVNEDRKPLFLSKNVEGDASSSPLRRQDPSIFESDGRIEIENNSNSGGAERRDDLVWESREGEAQEENTEQRLNLEEGEIQRKEEWTCHELDVGDGAKDDNKGHHTEDGINDRTIQEDDDKDVTQDCAVKDNKRLQESADGCRRTEEEIGDTCVQTSITHVDANGETGTNVTNVACVDSSTSAALSPTNPAPSLPPLGSMATGLPCLEAEKEEEEEVEEGVVVTAGDGEGGQEGKRELEDQGKEERGSTVATEEGRKEEEEVEVEEEDEFGVFMQAEGEPAWSEGSTMSASVPCGSRESVALGNHAITGESTHWTPGWTDGSFHQSDDTWTAFPQDSSDERRDVAGQWWPTSAVEESRDGLLTNQNLASVFAEAFPAPPASSSSDPGDLDTVPTLTQLLRGKASQDQGLLDSFHDLNKMICQRYKRANGVSRDLLLKTLHLQQPHTESRPAPRTASRRLSPGLPSANQHAQNAAAKRRLSYDYNRNIME